MPEIKWRMTCELAEVTRYVYGAPANSWQRRLRKRPTINSRFKSLLLVKSCPAFRALDAASAGNVEIGHTASYYYFGKDPTFAFGTSVAFGPNQRLNQGWYTVGGGKEVLNEFYKKYNVHSLLVGNTGCQMGGWFRKEINTVDDLKGLKMRIGGFPGRVLQKLGGVPQQIAGGDIYPALEKGTLDACEWVGPYDDEKLGFYKIAPHYYYPGWWEGGSMIMAFVNLDKWNALPKSYQAVLEQAGVYANTWMMAKYDQAQSGVAAQTAGRRHQAACVLAADHGSKLQRGYGIAWRDRERERELQKGQRLNDGLHAERISVVPGGGTCTTTAS